MFGEGEDVVGLFFFYRQEPSWETRGLNGQVFQLKPVGKFPGILQERARVKLQCLL